MVVPDWFIKLLELLGLRKQEKNPEDVLQDFYDQRKKHYNKLESIESEIKTLEKRLIVVNVTAEDKKEVSFSNTYIAKAKSDVYILRDRFNAISKKLALINSHILQLQMIIDGDETDVMAKEMENRLISLNKAVENLEYAAGIKDMVDETVEMGQKIEIKDVTIASYSANKIPEINTQNNKGVNNNSNNTNYNI